MRQLRKAPLSPLFIRIAFSWIALSFAFPSFADAVDVVEGVVEGVYELTSRQLSDGTVQKPPQIIGSLTIRGTE